MRIRSNIMESEKPIYLCPICLRLSQNEGTKSIWRHLRNERYDRLELFVHIKLHKRDAIIDELVRAIAGEEVDS